jgi:hypothetical protein
LARLPGRLVNELTIVLCFGMAARAVARRHDGRN